METKLIYRVVHSCIEFKLKTMLCFWWKEIFSLFFWEPKLISQAQLTSSSTQRWKHRKKGLKLLKRQRNRSRLQLKIFSCRGENDITLYDDQLLVLFHCKFPYVFWMKIYWYYWYLCRERENCLHLLLLEFRVLYWRSISVIFIKWFGGFILYETHTKCPRKLVSNESLKLTYGFRIFAVWSFDWED